MYNPKFDYQPIPRVTIEGRRYYATPDGNNLPSVTTILDKTKPPEKVEALNQWRRRVGAEKAQQITTEAANRGTRMHTYLEQYVKEYTSEQYVINYAQPEFVVLVNQKDNVYLQNMTVDYVRQGLNEGFEFSNPNERDRCGCGESFRI